MNYKKKKKKNHFFANQAFFLHNHKGSQSFIEILKTVAIDLPGLPISILALDVKSAAGRTARVNSCVFGLR